MSRWDNAVPHDATAHTAFSKLFSLTPFHTHTIKLIKGRVAT